jgi:hypothetical protein
MPWQDNIAWDDALDRDPGIGVGGGRTADGRPSTGFLFRPGQLVCDAHLWDEPADFDQEHVRKRLGAAGAEETRNASRLPRDELRASVADDLSLQLLNVPGADLGELVADARRRVPGALDYNHVLVASPQRHGGCAPPHLLDAAGFDFEAPVTQTASPLIAVLDTGIGADLPFDVLAGSDSEPASPGSPAEHHGTMVAGIVARYLPAAQLLVKQVLNMPLGEADELEIAAALAALPADVAVVNASFSGPAADDARMLAFERAVGLLPRSTLVVAAAGNEGLDRPHYMAAFKRVLAVASVAADGSALEDYSNRGVWVDVCTQGTDVETVIGGGAHVLASGTSFAAPKIAAKVAEIAAGQGVGMRHAASWLVNEAGAPAVAGGGTFVDIAGP